IPSYVVTMIDSILVATSSMRPCKRFSTLSSLASKRVATLSTYFRVSSAVPSISLFSSSSVIRGSCYLGSRRSLHQLPHLLPKHPSHRNHRAAFEHEGGVAHAADAREVGDVGTVHACEVGREHRLEGRQRGVVQLEGSVGEAQVRAG